jgi:AcrR family transcriptional regulator
MGRAVRTEIAPRTRPTQERARRTLELILDTAVELLEEGGAEGLTTKRLAERAGIRVRSVYRYFPNKLAVIGAVAERITRREQEAFLAGLALGGPEVPWRQALRRAFEAYDRAIEDEPGMLAVRRAVQSSPALRAIDARMNDALAESLAEVLQVRGMRGGPAHRRLVARTALEIAVALLDRADLDPTVKKAAQRRELYLAIEGYLAIHLDERRASRN